MTEPTGLDLVEPCLLDVNVLLALCDPLHEQHDAAHTWFTTSRDGGWATCAITENGFVRVASHPTYPNRLRSAQEARAILRQITALPGHRFWKDDVSLRDTSRFNDLTGLPAAATTDIYLLGLASAHGGRLATFDQKIPARFVPNGEHVLEIISRKGLREKRS